MQYLKFRKTADHVKDEVGLRNFLIRFYPEEIVNLGMNSDNFSFENSSLQDLENIRMFLLRKEEEYQVNSTLS